MQFQSVANRRYELKLKPLQNTSIVSYQYSLYWDRSSPQGKARPTMDDCTDTEPTQEHKFKYLAKIESYIRECISYPKIKSIIDCNMKHQSATCFLWSCNSLKKALPQKWECGHDKYLSLRLSTKAMAKNPPDNISNESSSPVIDLHCNRKRQSYKWKWEYTQKISKKWKYTTRGNPQSIPVLECQLEGLSQKAYSHAPHLLPCFPISTDTWYIHYRVIKNTSHWIRIEQNTPYIITPCTNPHIYVANKTAYSFGRSITSPRTPNNTTTWKWKHFGIMKSRAPYLIKGFNCKIWVGSDCNSKKRHVSLEMPQ